MFATLQGEFAHRILQSHSDDPDELSTIYVVLSCGGCDERLLGRSDAIIYILEGIGWASAATILAQLASPVRDWLYKIVARNRYRLFGKAELCPMLEASQRGKFLD
jgi:predicted DCC family thiol-disulfide oxidoreductase YuxK